VSGHATGGRPTRLLDAIQTPVACSTILAVFLIGRKLFDDRIGLVAALLVVIYPPAMIATNLWLTETLAAAVVV
jgi:4-amino-4-deoxy-L-arabinose transferase-like glycosyltransferase